MADKEGGMRTKKGNVTAKSRQKAGDKQGKFPIFDHKSCMSAVKLRGHSSSPGSVLSRAARWASAHGDKA